MKKYVMLSMLMAMLGLMGAKAEVSNVAYSDNQVRFTVISDGAVRLEYAPDGQFTDNKSFMAVNRDYEPVDYKVKQGSWIEITTPVLKLRYKKGSGEFTDKNLVITSASKKKDAFRFTWKPGMKQQQNLKGTFRTLDGYDGDVRTFDTPEGKKGEHMEIEDGIIARDGWTLIDDSKSLLFDGDPKWEWVTERKNTNGQDWYFMAYGTDYKRALKDYTRFAGKMPLPPRYAFGYWWSRYWLYSDKEVRNLAKDLRNYGFPLDVLVIDMDWHYTEKDRGGWTGWTWNKELFPNYRRLLKDLNDDNLKVTLNLHPADGVDWYEEKYPEVARAMGVDPATKQRIDWLGSDKKFMTTMFDKILNPMMADGVDFWWLDWQQHIYDRKLTTLKNTWRTSRCFFTNMQQYTEKRPMIYHRWSGLGNHRYQVGFSGDAIITWKSLDFQPYFNHTASNVLYGYWSHDLGGHMGGIDRVDPEMYTRWMQFGAMSPIMRTHSTKNIKLKKEPWVFDYDITLVLRNTVRQRYTMAPYIYSMARRAYDDAIALCRPMYYDYPKAQEAYDFRNEYMFGDQMLVSPITSPMTGTYSVQKTWLPEGEWFELATGTLLKGGSTVERTYAIDEYPIFVKAGAVLPFYTDKVQNLQGNDEDVVVAVFPGAEGGSFSMYEDNGDDQKYATEYATTALSSRVEGNELTVTIGARKGSYKDMPAQRRFSVKVYNRFLPIAATVNGKPAKCSYCGEDFAVIVEVPETDCSVEKVVKLTFADTAVSLDGMKARAHRIAKEMEAMKYRDAGVVFRQPFGILGSVSEAMDYAKLADQPMVVSDFMASYKRLPELLKAQNQNEEQTAAFLKSIDWKE
ncbi:MAG: glycoside hydrolase family 31 protein [Bacteroidales bacterium]|nr:glycoside hydrolase family 31 protein [Bacteroidales bacterium]